MKDIKDVVAWLEEEIAHYEMKADGNHNYLTKQDEARYILAQELLHWTLGSNFDSRYSASPVSRDTCMTEREAI